MSKSIYITNQSNATCGKALCTNIKNNVFKYKTRKQTNGALIVYSYMYAYTHNPKKWKIGQRHSQYCINLLIRHDLTFRFYIY